MLTGRSHSPLEVDNWQVIGLALKLPGSSAGAVSAHPALLGSMLLPWSIFLPNPRQFTSARCCVGVRVITVCKVPEKLTKLMGHEDWMVFRVVGCQPHPTAAYENLLLTVKLGVSLTQLRRNRGLFRWSILVNYPRCQSFCKERFFRTKP